LLEGAPAEEGRRLANETLLVQQCRIERRTSHLGVRDQAPRGRGHGAGQIVVVGVQESQEGAPGTFEAAIDGVRGTLIRLRVDSRAPLVLFQDLQRPVGGAAIHDDVFDMGLFAPRRTFVSGLHRSEGFQVLARPGFKGSAVPQALNEVGLSGADAIALVTLLLVTAPNLASV